MAQRLIKHYPTCPSCGASLPHRKVDPSDNDGKVGWLRCISCRHRWDYQLAKKWAAYALGRGPRPDVTM